MDGIDASHLVILLVVFGDPILVQLLQQEQDHDVESVSVWLVEHVSVGITRTRNIMKLQHIIDIATAMIIGA